MRDYLPNNHGLTQAILNSRLVRHHRDKVSLTNAQFEALAAGVAMGTSILLVSPTSTGKTEVGLIGIAAWLSGPDPMIKRAVYLVSHRALARQKYSELNGSEMLSIFGLDPAEMAMSNGDLSIDGNGAPIDDPLSARLLIATYEKFLALLAASGLRQDMSHYCFVADEFQLIGDSTRGQDVEILFTMIQQAGYGQFVGLSAVLDNADWRVLSEWLGAVPVIVPTREVPLSYELCVPSATYVWTTNGPDEPDEGPIRRVRSTIGVLTELEKDAKRNFPVAVFCMSKSRVEKLAKQWNTYRSGGRDSEPLQPDLFEEPTILSGALAVYMPNGLAMHTADLIEGERTLVEHALDEDQLAVVFATTTLAQGLNYSFKTVIFDAWSRYNSSRRQYEPIPRSDFHNIAGRAGRLGKMDDDSHGRVIFCAKAGGEQATAARYLSADMDRSVTGRLDPTRFDQVALQLLAAGIVKTSNDCLRLLYHSLSSHVARKSGVEQDSLWKERLDEGLINLTKWGLIKADV